MAEASDLCGLRRTFDAFAAVVKDKEAPSTRALLEVLGVDAEALGEDGARRMLVYRSLVRRGIAAAIKAQLPVTAARLGSALDTWIMRWLDERLPSSPYLRDVAGEFVAWVSPEWFDLETWPRWLGDLARHEVALFEVRAAVSGGERGGELELHKAARFDRAARLVRYAWAVHRWEEGQPAPPAEPTALLLYRDESYEVRHLELTPLAAAILERLLSGLALGDAIIEACASFGQTLDDAVLRGTAEMLADLGERGVLLGAVDEELGR